MTAYGVLICPVVRAVDSARTAMTKCMLVRMMLFMPMTERPIEAMMEVVSPPNLCLPGRLRPINMVRVLYSLTTLNQEATPSTCNTLT